MNQEQIHDSQRTPVGTEPSCRNFATPERMAEIANNAIDAFGRLFTGRNFYGVLSGALKMSNDEILAAGLTTLKEFFSEPDADES